MRRGHIVLFVILIVAISMLPIWPHSAGWGYIPSTAFGLLFLVVMIVVMLGRL